MEVTDFWRSLDCLGTVHQYAQARRVGPWSLLGATMLRAVASIGPEVQIPAIIGSPCSLNMFVAFVGPSGQGKGITDGAARDLLKTDAIAEYPIGSGEGIAATFLPDKDGVAIPRAIFTAPEVDTLAALGDRKGTTLLPELRKLYVGEQLGFANAGKDTRRIVPAQSYRACLSVGVQPERAAVLLNDAAGGTPQRFIWLPTHDEDAPDKPPDEPGQIKVSRGIWGTPPIYLRIPDEIEAEVDQHRLRVLRGDPDVDPLDGHARLTRIKIAAALALLDDAGINVGMQHWTAAGVVMRVSDSTRARIQSSVAAAARKANRARALAAADRDETISDRKHKRARDGVLRWLEKGNATRGDLNRKLKVDIRDHLDAALAELVDEGAIREIAQSGVYLCTTGTHAENRPSPAQTRCVPQVHRYTSEVVNEESSRPKRPVCGWCRDGLVEMPYPCPDCRRERPA